jgi:SPP1 gp7 family putative phage head morphogenesis protein
VYSEEQFIALEEEERSLTDEAIIAMMLVMATTKGNLEKELRNFYSKYGKDGVITYQEARKWISEKDRRKRLTVLSLYLSGEFLSALNDLEKHFRRFLIEVIAKESTFFGVTVDVDKLLSRKWGVDDLYWLERLEADVSLWQSVLLKDLKQAMHRGATLNEILEQFDKRFGSIDKILKKLGMSESTAVGSLARQDIFKELGVAKYQFFTKPDERRCEECGALHGTIFPMSAFEVGITASPIHPHCRCWEVPILE